MRAITVHIHNFRTFADVDLTLCPYSLLMGANNTGKSNLIDAIRVFYEKDIKYEETRDFPKFATPDKESWIEIQFKPSPSEFSVLKDEYRLTDETFRVRKYLQSSETDDEAKPKSGIYAYVSGQLSNTRFYGWKNVQQGKFGEVIHIPSASRLDDHTKLTGPSALRDLINGVLKTVMGTSAAYAKLKSAFDTFETNLKTEATADGHSLATLEAEVTAGITDWEASFELFITPIGPEDLVKNLVGHGIKDKSLGQTQDTKSYGQGFQRHLIFTLIRLAARYNAPPSVESKKDFSPRLTWILFEEPEAFLHPSQIDVLNSSLRKLGVDDATQILVTTHSPQFVSRSVEDLPGLARLCKTEGRSTIRQVSRASLQSILASNQQDLPKWQKAGIQISPEDFQVAMESVKYALWLNPLRCHAFFANRILLVEGATEAALIGYMLEAGEIPAPSGGVCIFDAIGKYNIHRFIRLFGEFGIPHAVLYDHDGGKPTGIPIEDTIQASKNEFTVGIDHFGQDLETYLGITPAGRPDRKPQHVMWHLKQGDIDPAKLSALSAKVSALLTN